MNFGANAAQNSNALRYLTVRPALSKVIVTQVEAEMSGFSSNDIASGTLTTSLENGQSFSP